MRRGWLWIIVPVAVVILWGLWIGGVLLASYSAEGAFDFSKSGAFGDSFGGLSAIMAALAATGAIGSIVYQRLEHTRQAFDANFFAVLGQFTQIVSEIDIQEYVLYVDQDGLERADLNREFVGRDALRVILGDLRSQMAHPTKRSFAEGQAIYNSFYNVWKDDLGHYFRVLYHLFSLVSEKCPTDKMFYARLIRAHLSNSELILLAYNCLYGEGRLKFVTYLEDFAVLHNVDADDLSQGEIQAIFGDFRQKVFGDRSHF